MKDNDPTTADILKSIHDTYTRLTGYQVRYLAQERMYYDFWKAGYTADNLALVIAHINAENRHHDYKRSLRIGKLIGDIQRFDETLAEAQKVARNRRVTTPSARALNEWRGVPPSESAPVGRVVSIKEALMSAINQETESQKQQQAL